MSVIAENKKERLEKNEKHVSVHAWEIWLIDVPAYADTSQFRGMHYYLMTCNDKGGKYSPMLGAMPFTSKEASLPTHISIIHDFDKIGLRKPSILSVESRHKVDRRWLKKKVGYISNEYVREKIRAAFIYDSGLF